MGKKRSSKQTRQVSVAVAEASSAAEEGQLSPPRKRGRPRKIVEKTENEARREEEGAINEAVEEREDVGISRSDLERVRITGEEGERGTTSFKGGEEKEEKEQFEGGEEEEEEDRPTRSRRARRKSKPRKSS